MQCYVRRALARLWVQRARALPLPFGLLFRGPLTVVCAVVCLWARTVGDGPGRDVVMKQLKSRAGTLNEIIKSEAAYVQYLTVLMEVRVVGRVRVVPPLRLTRTTGAIGGVERRRSRCPFGRRRCCDWTTSCASLPTSAVSCRCTYGSSATSRTATPIGTLPSFLTRHFLLRHRTTLARHSHDTGHRSRCLGTCSVSI